MIYCELNILDIKKKGLFFGSSELVWMNILMIGGISDPEEGERMKDWKNLGMQSKISHETERQKGCTKWWDRWAMWVFKNSPMR